MECFVRLGQGRVEPVTSTFIGEGALQDFEGSPGCMGLVTVVKNCRLTPGGDWVYPGWELYAETRPKGRREDEDVLLPHVENLAGKWGVVLVIAALKALGWVRVRPPLGERVHVARGVPAAGFLQRTKLSNTPSVPTVSPPPPPLPLPTKYNNYFQTTSPPPL